MILENIAAAEVPASRVFPIADMFADPQFPARRTIESATLPLACHAVLLTTSPLLLFVANYA